MKTAIIPARGGSKRIPSKNIKLFAGHPIISYSINAARESGLFDRIIVSTDSTDIAKVAVSCGAETPFLRPAEIADDFTGTLPVLIHALNWLRDNGSPAEYFCCIYPTAPFLTAELVRKGFDLMKEKDADTAFTVTSFPYPIMRALKIRGDGRVAMFWPEHENTRSNDLPAAYHDAGQLYWGRTERLLASGRLISGDAVPIILPRYLVQDIDTPEDWDTAERMFQALRSRKD